MAFSRCPIFQHEDIIDLLFWFAIHLPIYWLISPTTWVRGAFPNWMVIFLQVFGASYWRNHVITVPIHDWFNIPKDRTVFHDYFSSRLWQIYLFAGWYMLYIYIYILHSFTNLEHTILYTILLYALCNFKYIIRYIISHHYHIIPLLSA